MEGTGCLRPEVLRIWGVPVRFKDGDSPNGDLFSLSLSLSSKFTIVYGRIAVLVGGEFVSFPLCGCRLEAVEVEEHGEADMERERVPFSEPSPRITHKKGIRTPNHLKLDELDFPTTLRGRYLRPRCPFREKHLRGFSTPILPPRDVFALANVH